VENGYWADRDNELRVWYTAFSRAKERLFVIHPSDSSSLLPIFA
jgi:ATP-dependent exoDNAse (exonuclease V) beta subunit